MEAATLSSLLDPPRLPVQEVSAFSLQHISAFVSLIRLNSAPSNSKYSSVFANLCFLLPVRHRASQRSLQNVRYHLRWQLFPLAFTLPPYRQIFIFILSLVIQVIMLSSWTTVAFKISLYHVLPPIDSILFYCGIRINHGFRWCQSGLLL